MQRRQKNMKIKKVKEEIKNDYPQKNEISKEKIKKCIPKKWKILGISALTITIAGGTIYKIIENETRIVNGGMQSVEINQVSLFNGQFYRYAGNADIIFGTRTKELIRYAIEMNIEITTSFDLESHIDKIDEYIKAEEHCKITYTNNEQGYISTIFIEKVTK